VADEYDKDTQDLNGLTDDERRKLGGAPDPVLPGEQAPKVTPPTPVKWSFWLWIVGGVLLILSYVQLLSSKSAIIAQVTERTKDPKYTPQMIADGITSRLWYMLFGSIVFVLLFVLFAYKAREGTRSARTVVTVLPVVMVLLILVIAPIINFLTVAALIVLIVAIALLYVAPGYFPKAGRKP
jgi:peptidoglycan/LPS O-acetylase OafA/YrhL